jgi:1-deoxy-D-xylulose-5-phosphate reductoisomerase
MGIPIALGLGWPDRVPDAGPACDWTRAATWTFEPLDDGAFPAVRLARAAGEAGGTTPAVFNAANEVCVDAFLAGRLPFTGIVDTLARVLDDHETGNLTTVADVVEAETWARNRAADLSKESASL